LAERPRSTQRLMVRLLYALGTSAIVAACGISGLCVWQCSSGRSQRADVNLASSVLGAFREKASHSNGRGFEEKTPPLVKQAEAFASCLVPAQPAKKAEVPVTGQATTMATPPIRPVIASVKFKLVGTSYYPNQPKRSMALISEPDSGVGSERWVKEGAQVEHFVIHEIRHGLIIYRDGDNLREMAVESGMSTPSLVQDTRLGVRKVSAAVDGIGTLAPIGNGPNSIEIIGGN
jgi:hypothetical protein